MPNRYLFDSCKIESGLDSNELVEDGVSWNHDHQVQEPTIYTEEDETVMQNNNETYMTANDGHDDTQYFSILESSADLALNNLSNVYTLGDETLQEEKLDNEDEDKTFFYAIEGCNDLFAVSLVQDVDGNTKKIQYKMRLKEDGEYETVQDSMEYVPMDDDDEVTTREDLEKQFSVGDLIKQETYNEHNLMLGDGASNSSDSNSECKLRVDEHEEILQNFFEEQTNQENEENHAVDTQTENSEPFEEVFLSANEDSNSTDYVNVNSLPEDAAYEFLHEESDENDANVQGVEEYLNNFEENASDVEDYQICEGVHVTGDLLENEPKEVPYLCKTNESSQILKTHLQIDPNLNAVELKKEEKQFYFIVKCAEKENRTQIAVGIPADNKIGKPNPRSLLKISQHETIKKDERVVKNNTRFIASKKVPKTQTVARHTVSHAPVRRERLPRKQTIKPVQREDEEIIVQEVVVSSNGFVQTSEGGVVKSKVPLKPSLIVNLSDSDEYEHERKKRRKSKKRKIPEIVITDSDDESSSGNIVQIDLSRDSDGEKKEEKRKRGRPRKKPLIDLDDSAPAKKVNEPENKENEKDVEPKPTWQCLKCPKSFPSAGSLKTHTLHHNFQQSKILRSTRESTIPLTSKYQCQTCKDCFKNKILLSNHIRKAHVENTSKFVCTVCKKPFNDNLQLLVHKRAHVKEQMFKRTTLASASPKMITKPSPNKCAFCSKTFSIPILLKAHMKTHKLFTCSTCSVQFMSKFTFDNHFRTGCVKLKPKTNIFKTPTKKQISTRPTVSPSSSSESINLMPTLKCDLCSIQFYTNKALYNHKVVKHELKTLDRDEILQNSTKKKLLTKNVPEHSSVPASERLRLCYAGIRTNLYK